MLLKMACGHSARPIFFISFLLILLSGVFMLRDSLRYPARQQPDERMPAPRTPGA